MTVGSQRRTAAHSDSLCPLGTVVRGEWAALQRREMCWNNLSKHKERREWKERTHCHWSGGETAAKWAERREQAQAKSGRTLNNAGSLDTKPNWFILAKTDFIAKENTLMH